MKALIVTLINGSMKKVLRFESAKKIYSLNLLSGLFTVSNFMLNATFIYKRNEKKNFKNIKEYHTLAIISKVVSLK